MGSSCVSYGVSVMGPIQHFKQPDQKRFKINLARTFNQIRGDGSIIVHHYFSDDFNHNLDSSSATDCACLPFVYPVCANTTFKEVWIAYLRYSRCH